MEANRLPVEQGPRRWPGGRMRGREIMGESGTWGNRVPRFAPDSPGGGMKSGGWIPRRGNEGLGGVGFRGEALAAAAFGGRVRVLEHELLGQALLEEVDPGAVH